MVLNRRVIALVNVVKSYGRLPVLKGVNLTVCSKTIVVIKGRSGVGKTTLAKILALLEKPDSGYIEFMGIRVERLSASKRASLRLKYIGYIDQHFTLLPGVSVRENVELPLLLLNVAKHERLKMVKTILEKLGLSGKIDKTPEELSGGERQRVAIARALVKKPLLLVADEPFSNLDEYTTGTVFREFVELARNGSAVVITTTELTHTFSSSIVNVREYVLSDGRLLPLSKYGGEERQEC